MSRNSGDVMRAIDRREAQGLWQFRTQASSEPESPPIFATGHVDLSLTYGIRRPGACRACKKIKTVLCVSGGFKHVLLGGAYPLVTCVLSAPNAETRNANAWVAGVLTYSSCYNVEGAWSDPRYVFGSSLSRGVL